MSKSEAHPDHADSPAVPGWDCFGPQPGWQIVDAGELWRYRELGFVLAMRDFKVRYRQAMIGALWAVIQPVSTLLVFQVLFMLLQRTPTSGEVPYPVTALCGLIPWYLFATLVRDASDSLVNNRHIITKIYFPRLLLPIGTSLVALIDFAISFCVLIGVMLYFGMWPAWTWLWVLPFTAITVAAALAIGIWLSALNALYRDVKYIVPFLLQLGFYVTPTFYEQSSLIPARWQFLQALNPLTGVIAGFRWALTGTNQPEWSVMAISFTSLLVLLGSGLLFFRRAELSVTDRI
ncbi:ABC transporter permease [Rubinisphaera sp. JC750]|uniref:ABC transporter permease n=1 Tax=Rubinisphaera sp. JC750 TaxID=2898658 RepID=UPI001F40CA17|nr:ABC transporter permease [Rubinisphaera sp. JC750]